MLKILDHPTEHMSRVEMHKRYKGYAFIVVDTQENTIRTEYRYHAVERFMQYQI